MVVVTAKKFDELQRMKLKAAKTEKHNVPSKKEEKKDKKEKKEERKDTKKDKKAEKQSKVIFHYNHYFVLS